MFEKEETRHCLVSTIYFQLRYDYRIPITEYRLLFTIPRRRRRRRNFRRHPRRIRLQILHRHRQTIHRLRKNYPSRCPTGYQPPIAARAESMNFVFRKCGFCFRKFWKTAGNRIIIITNAAPGILPSPPPFFM